MTPLKWLAVAILVPFSLLSVYAVSEVGYLGIFTYHLPNPAGWQVFTDLVIALLLVMIWMVSDARRHGISPWPFIVLTLTLGSIGPLVYLLRRPTAVPVTA